MNTPFTLKVSTRNLIRDRFLAAGQGGYYVESSVLQNGLERGHFHTACRMLASTNAAPDPAPGTGVLRGHRGQEGRRRPRRGDYPGPRPAHRGHRPVRLLGR